MDKYIDPQHFVSQIDNTFWRYITKEGNIEDIIKFKDISKSDFLHELVRKINGGLYRPQAARIIGFPKSNGVIRPVLHFSLEDTLVYYYCVKYLQDHLIKKIKRTEYAFGGFRITEKLKINEQEIEELVFNPEYEMFIKSSFRKSWSDYQNLAKTLAEAKFDYYMHLDIAHFYDAIPLAKLEQDVRSCGAKNKNVVDLLFYLLKNIKPTHNYTYTENSVGIPQEEIGEMSRMLANFYLSTFDERVVIELKNLFMGEKGIKWQYARYADDLWFAFRGPKSDALRITQIVSQLLSDIYLHLNESKTKIMTVNDFMSHWKFEDWEQIMLNKKNTKILVEKMIELSSKKDADGRWFSPFHYIVKTIPGRLATERKIIDQYSEQIFDELVSNPHFAGRNSSSFLTLVIELMKGKPDRIGRVLKIVTGDEIMYPVVSFVLWNAFFKLPFNVDYLDIFQNQYYSSKWRDLWWYERCLFIRYFIEMKIFEIDKERTNTLLEHLDASADNLTSHERRYVIRFLIKLPDGKGEKILMSRFNTAHDKKLIDFIRKNKC